MLKVSRVGEPLFYLFSEGSFLVNLLNDARFWYLVAGNSQVKVHIPCDMSVWTVFETQLYFHAVALIERELTKEKQNIF